MGVQNSLRSAGAQIVRLINISATDRILVDVVPFAHG